MTREEAINQLQDAKDGYKEYLSNDALDLAIEALEQEPRWISVSKELPQDGERLIDDDVLVSCEDGQIRIGFCMGADLNGNREWCMIGEYSKVIAWMPLPQPYREVEE